MAETIDKYDAVIIGFGKGGKTMAGLAAARGGSFQERAAAYKEAMEQKEELTARLREKNYQKLDSNPNIRVIDGTGRFLSPHVVEVEHDGRTFQIEGELIFINTGSSAFIPPIEGLEGNPYVYTSESLLNLRELPKRLERV